MIAIGQQWNAKPAIGTWLRILGEDGDTFRVAIGAGDRRKKKRTMGRQELERWIRTRSAQLQQKAVAR